MVPERNSFFRGQDEDKGQSDPVPSEGLLKEGIGDTPKVPQLVGFREEVESLVTATACWDL